MGQAHEDKDYGEVQRAGREAWRPGQRLHVRTQRPSQPKTPTTDTTHRYLSYYFPALIWLRQYKLSFLKGDFIAALTIAGMYLPMALSLADTLAHVPPINGLYAFVFNPFIYSVLGTAPQMILGPEAPGSLLVGSVVKGSVDRGRGSDDDAVMHAQICGIIAGTAGATILLSGLFRLGFLDSVLSKPFLRGFISAIGFVIFVEQLMPELGLAQLAADHVGHGSTMDKLTFILTHTDDVHVLTAVISLVSFTIVMTCRYESLPLVCSHHHGPEHADIFQGDEKEAATSLPKFGIYSRPSDSRRFVGNSVLLPRLGRKGRCHNGRNQGGLGPRLHLQVAFPAVSHDAYSGCHGYLVPHRPAWVL